MTNNSPNGSNLHNKAQLDKSEREEIEKIVYQMRERVESYYRHVLEEQYGLDSKPEGEASEDKKELVTAIERELTEDKSWDEALDQYIKGLGYTLVNRLAAFRCMEVRDFIDREVTQFRESRTPAADPLVEEEFMDDNEATIEAYKRECDSLAEEIEILFDLSDPYSILDPEIDLFGDLCELLDEIDDKLWLADDVLGWVYEYYNAPDLEDVREKARNEGLDPEDTTVANQFYTPHWVVRMLTDNSLGKLFLEYKGSLQDTIKKQQDKFSVEDRKNRSTHPGEAPSITELCTYLVPTEEEGEPTDFDHPSEIRVLDPACGSGHFLLYAFDILERIWWEETDVDRKEVPRKILENNLFGVDLDLRACQLAAFNLYLKGRSRAEEEGNNEFTMPQLGIVCSDSNIADIKEAEEVFEEVAGDQPELKERLESILKEFQEIPGLGSLLNVKDTLSEEFIRERSQFELTDFGEESDPYLTLEAFLEDLHDEIEGRYNNSSFLAHDLQSFLRLVKILSQEYDVALMNPPYGSGSRLPLKIKKYIDNNYRYYTEYYISFFEVCKNLAGKKARIGMLVPWSFMFNSSFESFRHDFIEGEGQFEFLAEFGYGILDNAMVGTVATVINLGSEQNREGIFLRLNDVEKAKKEEFYLNSLYSEDKNKIKRRYNKKLEEFKLIQSTPLSYWTPKEIREVYDSEIIIDKDNTNINKEDIADVKLGMATGNNDRFLSYFWENRDIDEVPYSKGGSEAWMLPKVNRMVNWKENGEEIKRIEGSSPQNEEYYFSEAISYTVAKRGGKRFGYLNSNSIFDMKGTVIIPEDRNYIWNLIGYLNSEFVNYLMLAQTSERMWQIGMISKLPWFEGLQTDQKLESLSKELASLILSKKTNNVNSPYYDKPLLLELLDENIKNLEIHQKHSHRELMKQLKIIKPKFKNKDISIEKLITKAKTFRTRINKNILEINNRIDSHIYSYFDIVESQKEDIKTEISLRQSYNHVKQHYENQEDIEDREYVKELLHHFVLTIMKDDIAIILDKESDVEDPDMMEHIVYKFEEVWGEYAEERLAEADQILGDKKSGDEAYPNIRHFLENELFEFHLKEFENTPIIWNLTTDRLVSDPEGTGFSCLIDYHQLDEDLFDTLKSRYLEPRKSALREKRSTADHRRSDPSLDATEQAEATDEYNRCQSALRQIEELEQKMKELSQVHKRDWSEENQKKAEKLVPKVREFRERLEERLSTLDKLRETADEDWLEDTFSPTFFDRVDENREEWIDALKDLEKACRSYSKNASTPVEAHLYDLFPYFADKLTGTTHYGSNGIFFMNYYFSKGQEYLEDGEPREGMAEHLRLFAELAAETDQDVELGEEIIEECEELEKSTPSDWKDRALSEVMTGGYSPVKKHGVAINIEPLAKKNIVPKIVEDKVIL